MARASSPARAAPCALYQDEGTAVPSVRYRREEVFMAGRVAPPGSTYGEQRHYVIPASLTDLRGPVAGVITLDQRLDWSGDGRYDLDDPGDLQLFYQTVLNQAGTADQLGRRLNEETLRRI